MPMKLTEKTLAQRKSSAPTVMMFPSESHVDLIVGMFRSRSELCVIVKSKVAKFLFDITTDLPLCCGHERVPALSEDLPQILCKIMTNQIRTKDGVRQSETFVDGHCVRHTATRIHHDAVVRPETYRTNWLAVYMACTLKISNIICVMRSRSASGSEELL